MLSLLLDSNSLDLLKNYEFKKENFIYIANETFIKSKEEVEE
jgi:hypothetical protein